MLKAEFGEAGPSVLSEKPEERIAARRLRIAARNEAKKRQDLGEDSQEMQEAEAEARTSQKQVELSEKHLLKLQTDGTELVTNILVAADARETKRRAKLEEARRLRNEKLENEAKSSLEKFEEIIQKWTVAKAKEIPQDLRDALKSQQKLCALLIEDKNKLISELQQELKASDDRYVKDLKKQAEDVDLMRERMQEQVTSLMKVYRQELDLIENSFDDERKTLLTGNRKQWEQQRKERSDKELEHLLQRMKQLEEYEVLLQRLRLEDMEENNMIKVKLETDVEILQLELQKTKATYQLNQEKLEYNFHVLKKREDENTITKSQQKRKITRLQDTLKTLKTKCASQEKQSQEENQSLTDGYKRSMQQYKDVQKKMRHFAAIDAKRFEEMWLMNEGEAKALVNRALETDRLIHEQLLGLAWVPPPMPFMEHSGPIQPQHQAQRTARQIAMQVLGGVEEKRKIEGESSTAEGAGDMESLGVDRKTVKRLLELLCDETGFLIESKLLKLLSPLEKDAQSLMKLDSIFAALGIENEEAVYKMAEFFVKYKQQQKDQPKEDMTKNELEPEMDSDLIHPNDLVKALRAFTAQCCRPRDAQSQKQSSVLSLEERDDSEDAAYWESMADVIPESKLRVWNALEAALKKYHAVLTGRSKLLTDAHHLKQQNSELRTLLHQYSTQKGQY
ncbi:dynein regulatory complex protein 1 isoform X2 [Salminus brasiliensis]|uniref:dynein regulatory complex protein 1 isoform X2 n=1 Tax=Salminus brasiliensis TaxID=930266 RepID=UPI003B82E49A